MKIKNKRGLIVGIMTTILAIICITVYINYHGQRFLISSLLLIALSAVNFIKAFSQKGILEELAENADERDLYLTMKSSHLVIKTINYTICTFTFIFLILYEIWKSQFLIIIACTLCAVLVLIFLIYLLVNIYLDKHE